MPKGPFGLPRLTGLGPFVEPDKIRPSHDTQAGTYPLRFINSVQPTTAVDTGLFLGHGDTMAVDILLDEDIAEFEYKKISLGRLLEDSEFSRALMDLVEGDTDEAKRKIHSGELDSAEQLCSWLQWEDTQRDRKRCADKVENDIERVREINQKIRSSREYFPPTVFPIDEEGDTIDGAHRIVALASILGTEQEIWVWELKNSDDVMDDLEVRGVRI